MRRYSLNARRTLLALGATLVASLGVATTVAQAQLLHDVNAGGTDAGVALTPDARGGSLPAGITALAPGGSCSDPWLSTDLTGPPLPTGALCYENGAVIHKNETFALTWDAPQTGGWGVHNYWSQTRGYVERFLRDVADGSGSTGSPFAVTPQYNDAGGRAQNASLFGGGCIDLGSAGGSACEFGSPTSAGYNFPSGDCGTPQGASFFEPAAIFTNSLCLTDAQIQDELKRMIPQTGILQTQPGYTPLVSLLLPPGVETCLDNDHKLCSANSSIAPPPPALTTATTGGSLPDGTYEVELTYVTAAGESVPSSAQTITTSGGNTSTITIASPPSATGATGWYAYVIRPNGSSYQRLQSSATAVGTNVTWSSPAVTGGGPAAVAFCSYHSQVDVNGTKVAYVVQPWTFGTACDEPGAPNIPNDPTPQQLSISAGQRLVSPLSQGEIAAITDPGLNGWVANLTGDEIDDNQGCTPLPRSLDSVTVGGNSGQNPYFLQREWNNAAALDSDPNTYGCTPSVILSPDFVVPSSINAGDVVQLDGSASATTLLIPNAGYSWSFGDGTHATGPSVVHTYAKGGTYNVTLQVTDRGGNVDTLTQTIQVLGSDGQPVTSPGPAPATPAPAPGPGSGAGGALLNARLQLLPQSLKSVLHKGIAVRVSSNKAANGIATVWITRAAAKRAHIKVGRATAVRIGIGTVSSITNGTVTLRLHLSPALAKKLAHLAHLKLTVRLALVAAGNQQVAVDVAGQY